MQQLIIEVPEAETEFFTCIECSDTSLVTDLSTGDRICQSCGTVQNETNEINFESTSFSDVREHTYIEHLYKGSCIGLDKSSSRLRLPALRKVARYAITYRQTCLKAFQSDLKSVAPHFGVSEHIVSEAFSYIRRVLLKSKVRGRWPFPLAALAVATRCRGQPRFVDELISCVVDKKNTVEYKEMKRNTFRYIKLIHRICTPKKTLVPPEVYVRRFASHKSLQLNALPIIELCKELRRKQPLLVISGSPPIVAASLVYIGTILQGIKCDQPTIARISMSSVISIRNRYIKMVKALGLPIVRGKLITN